MPKPKIAGETHAKGTGESTPQPSMPATATVRRRRAAGPVVLPKELAVWEILLRLQAKDILRCRAVCRSWRRRTSEPGFLLAHHRRRPSLPLVAFHGQLPAAAQYGRQISVVDAAIDTLDLRRHPSAAARQPVLRFNDYSYQREFFAHASCDGLLLLSLGNQRFYLCNPATRQWASLPRLTGADGPMLYPHAPSGEYRVIYWKGRYTRARKVVYHVITAGSSAKPRRVEAMEPSAKRLVEAGWLHLSCSPGVFLHGCLHWFLYGFTEKLLVVFDTVAECFGSMPSPVAADSTVPQLLVMGATLAVSWTDESNTMMKLWVLQDYETGVWSLKRRIIFPVVEMWSVVRNFRFSGTVVSEDGDVLLHHPGSFHLFHSDCKGELVQKFRWERVFPSPAGHCFRESLVRHQFFERKEGARARRQPRFFRGL